MPGNGDGRDEDDPGPALGRCGDLRLAHARGRRRYPGSGVRGRLSVAALKAEGIRVIATDDDFFWHRAPPQGVRSAVTPPSDHLTPPRGPFAASFF